MVSRTKKELGSFALEEKIVQFLSENKAQDVVLIDLSGKTDFARAMVVASGTSGRFLSSLAQKTKDFLKEYGVSEITIEGEGLCDWVLIDTGDVIVHLFRPEVRSLYNLEKMWADFSSSGKKTQI